MGFLSDLSNAARRIVIPTPEDVLAVPKKLRKTSENAKLNEINVRYWDRSFRNPKDFKGTIDTTTSIPIVYFDNPKPNAIIQFDDCTYEDKEGKIWIEAAQDYAYGIDRNSDLAEFLNTRYYNDFADGKVQDIKDEKYKAYMIPVLLNRIPRPIIKINLGEKLNVKDHTWVTVVAEVTKDMIQQLGTSEFLRGRGKKSNGAFFVGCMLGGFAGIVAGIFITFSFLMPGG